MEPRLHAIGVKWGTFQILTAVQSAGGEATQAQIARRLGITPATLSEAVSEHVQSGLLEQVGKVGDRRAKVLKLTGRSRELMVQVKDVIHEMEQVIVRGIDGPSMIQCADTLDRAIASLEDAVGSVE